ncbi:MAG TPA: SPOR domain-containing protein [Blastocatellia bacterium]|nr:SPOR domain-containing protein [Blastocatellia bacterium]
MARQVEVAAPLDFVSESSASGPLPQDEDYEMVSLEPALDGKKDFLEEPEESFNQSAAAARTAPEAPANEAIPREPEAFVTQARPEVSGEQAGASEADISPRDETQTAIDESATDPWDDPLPAWEYSRNEWPIALVEEKPSAFARLKIPLVIALMVAVAAVAAYFLFKPSAETPQEPIAVATPEPSEPPATDDAAQPGAATDSNSAAPATGDKQEAPAQTAAGETATNDGADAKWRHSLQAMASQNADEAIRFAERLVRAGVPAYVVPADLGHRGKWHRVRVGRFVTADEALRFAGEARARAKAAGVTLKELNLCDYEKP